MLSPGCYLSITSITSFLMTTSHSITSSSNRRSPHTQQPPLHTRHYSIPNMPLSPNHTHPTVAPDYTLYLSQLHASTCLLQPPHISHCASRHFKHVTISNPTPLTLSPGCTLLHAHFKLESFLLQPQYSADSIVVISHHALLFFPPRPLSPFSTQRYHQRIFHSESHTLGVVTLMQRTVHKTFLPIRFTTSTCGKVFHAVGSLRCRSLTSVKHERRPRIDSLTLDGNINSCVTTNP